MHVPYGMVGRERVIKGLKSSSSADEVAGCLDLL